MSTVDQQRVRRTRTGLIAHDPVRALQGYTLFTPMFGDGTVYLVDTRGEVVHTWRLPHRPGLYGYLLDNGHLFYSGKVMTDLERFEAWGRFTGVHRPPTRDADDRAALLLGADGQQTRTPHLDSLKNVEGEDRVRRRLEARQECNERAVSAVSGRIGSFTRPWVSRNKSTGTRPAPSSEDGRHERSPAAVAPSAARVTVTYPPFSDAALPGTDGTANPSYAAWPAASPIP